jgi:hypothetical protein
MRYEQAASLLSELHKDTARQRWHRRMDRRASLHCKCVSTLKKVFQEG